MAKLFTIMDVCKQNYVYDASAVCSKLSCSTQSGDPIDSAMLYLSLIHTPLLPRPLPLPLPLPLALWAMQKNTKQYQMPAMASIV